MDPLVEAVVATAASGRGSLVLAPDARDLARLDAALAARLGQGRHVVLAADSGPAKRYRAFLAAARGQVRVVIGTRAAAFAPVADLGLVAMWDDGDDLYDEPRAPYPHAREVLLLRAAGHRVRCAAGRARAQRGGGVPRPHRLGRRGDAPRDLLRERVQVAVPGTPRWTSNATRTPGRAAAARGAAAARARARGRTGAGAHPAGRLRAPPGLRTLPRAGLVPGLPRAAAHRGPGEPPRLPMVRHPRPGWACPECGGRGLRAPVLGDRRTAEEIGRALPGVPVRSSAADHVLDRVPDRPGVVVATPGAEPVAEGGYAAVLLLDTWLRWGARTCAPPRRPCVGGPTPPRSPAPGAGCWWSATRRTRRCRRWSAGTRPASPTGRSPSASPPTSRPASRVATITADPADVEEVLAALPLPAGAEVLGPVEVEPPAGGAPLERLVVRVPRVAGDGLSAALKQLQVHRSTRKLRHVRVEVDPVELG